MLQRLRVRWSATTCPRVSRARKSGNWEIALGDQVGVAGGFVSTTGDDPWVGTITYSFVLEYSSSTGVATFQVNGTGFVSSLLTTPDYGIDGYGFGGITLGVRTRATTTMVLSNLVLNGVSLAPSGYTGTPTYTTYAL